MELARTRREIAILLVAVLGFLGLFVTKAYAIDDPLFLWLAGNIREHPLDFYGFDVNWYGTAMPMHEVTMNPPLAGYYIAAVGALVGLSEVAVHTAFLLPVAAVCLGTYRLARDLCGRPLLASLMGLLTPVFLVASTSVMCDTLMLASWCWSVNCWRDGLSRERGRLLVLAGVLAALAGLTKYFGFALVPLLGLHGLLTRRRLGTWVLPLLIPVAAGVAYELGTAAMYGHGLISGAGRYAASLRESESLGFGPTFLSGLVFCGGCMATAIFLGPLLAGARWTLVGFGVLFLAALAIPEPHELLCHPKAVVVTNTHGLDLQILLMAYGGAVVTALGLAEVRRWRDPDSVLLGCWILGTLVFAACLNWVNNGRSILPMAPAVGIVLARRLELGLAPRQLVRRALVPALAASVLLAGVVTYADVRWANQSRRAASDMAHEYGDLPLFFYGHWGFQYYAQLAGARRFDPGVDVLRAGSVIVVPTNNYGTLELHPSVATQVSAREYRGLPWVHTASLGSGACFYANNIAPLPFAIGSALPDTYVAWKVHKTFHYAKRQAQGQGPGGAPPPTLNHESAQPPAAAAGGQPRR